MWKRDCYIELGCWWEWEGVKRVWEVVVTGMHCRNVWNGQRIKLIDKRHLLWHYIIFEWFLWEMIAFTKAWVCFDHISERDNILEYFPQMFWVSSQWVNSLKLTVLWVLFSFIFSLETNFQWLKHSYSPHQQLRGLHSHHWQVFFRRQAAKRVMPSMGILW